MELGFIWMFRSKGKKKLLVYNLQILRLGSSNTSIIYSLLQKRKKMDNKLKDLFLWKKDDMVTIKS